MQAELKKNGKIMMCEACDHVFHFSSRPGTVKDCPSCDVTLYRARSNDFIATRHIYAEKKDAPQLAEVIRPKFEKKLLLSDIPLIEKEEPPRRPKSIKVCETCYSIQDVIEGEGEKPCAVCFPTNKKQPVEPTEEQIIDSDFFEPEEIEYVAIDFQEKREEEPAERQETEEIFPEQKAPETIVNEQKNERHELAAPHSEETGLLVSSVSLASMPISASIDFSEPVTGLAAPIFKKTETELAPAYKQIKLPEISGAMVDNDLWMNFKKQTVFSKLKDQLDYSYHPKKKKSIGEDTFNYQVRQVIIRYVLLGGCLVATVGVVAWSIINTF